jgi:hypothetical protein
VVSHSPDLKGLSVDDKALTSQISVKESSKDHNLAIVQSEAAKLTALGIAAGALKEN